MLMRRTTPLPIVANEMETTKNGHIAILPDGSFALTRAHGGPLVATFFEDVMEAINHVGARVAHGSAAAPASAVELTAQRPATLTPAEQALAERVASSTVATAAAALPGSSPGIAASTATPAALTPAEQALAAHITATIHTP